MRRRCFLNSLRATLWPAKGEFPADLLPDLLYTYLKVLEKVRALEADTRLAQEETADVVNSLAAVRYDMEARQGPVSKKRIREIIAQARRDVAGAGGSLNKPSGVD